MALLEVVTPLPKFLFIMLEDDIIKELKHSRNETIRYLTETRPHDLVLIMGRNVEWLYHEIRKLLAGHNDALPKKARKEVTIVWTLPTRHMNYANDHLREILGSCIENLVEVYNDKNIALHLKQNWDQFDPSIFFFDSQRYSTDGLNRLWRSFDRTVWYANILVQKLETKKSQEATQRPFGNTGQPMRGGANAYRGSQSKNYFAKKRFYTKFGKYQKRNLPPPP